MNTRMGHQFVNREELNEQAQEFYDNVDAVLVSASDLMRAGRSTEYGPPKSNFIYQDESFMSMVWVKMSRLDSIMNAKRDALATAGWVGWNNFDRGRLADSLIDLMAYCAMWSADIVMDGAWPAHISAQPKKYLKAYVQPPQELEATATIDPEIDPETLDKAREYLKRECFSPKAPIVSELEIDPEVLNNFKECFKRELELSGFSKPQLDSVLKAVCEHIDLTEPAPDLAPETTPAEPPLVERLQAEGYTPAQIQMVLNTIKENCETEPKPVVLDRLCSIETDPKDVAREDENTVRCPKCGNMDGVFGRTYSKLRTKPGVGQVWFLRCDSCDYVKKSEKASVIFNYYAASEATRRPKTIIDVRASAIEAKEAEAKAATKKKRTGRAKKVAG